MNEFKPSIDDITNAISILKKVKQYEQSNEYSRFLFIIAIIGIIAIFEGFLAYLIERYVGTSITKVFMGQGIANDPVLIIGLWTIQIAIFSSLFIYSSTSKGLLDTWTPYLKKLAIVWAFLYLGAFLVNVALIQLGPDQELFGPSIWAICIGLAIFSSGIILKPKIESSSLSKGFYLLTLILFTTSLGILLLDKIYAMFTIGMVIGISLLLLAGYLYYKS